MRRFIEVVVVGSVLIFSAGAQESGQPVLRKGVSVQMAAAEHAVAMPAADKQEAIVIAITAEGKLYAGIEPVEPAALNKLTSGTVYVKADSRVPFQRVLSVLDALRGKSVVLLAAPPKNAVSTKIMPPYGVEVTVAR